MHDEFLKRLWECASGECFNCSQYTETTNASVCSKELMKQAADAIEELRMKLHGDEAAIAGMKREIERMVVANASNTLNNDAMRWIPVTERLPLYGQDVLAVRTYGDGEKCQEVLMAHIAVWNEETGKKWWNATNITHWMPLPEPPKEK